MTSNDEAGFGDPNKDSESVEKSILLLKSGQLNDIATLHEGFNLHRMPQNYLNKRSYIEKIIFHATMSDAFKSPFSGFTIANRFLAQLDSIDVVSGIRNLKSLAKIVLDPNQRTSIMVHRIGNTWLLDEFNIDSFLLAGEQSPQWRWLRKFLSKKNFYLCAEAFSRNTLILRDLYIKFLYHTVNQSPHLGLYTIENLPCGTDIVKKYLPAPTTSSDSSPEFDKTSPKSGHSALQHTADDSSPSHIVESSQRPNNVRNSVDMRARTESNSKRPWAANPDEYLHMAKWQLQDLSFLVGSDLAIFGTPKHPCISLKLSPMHESINVLTGVDIWLENLLNEVPEVAMCYHHEGIVMQEYEIYKTCDLPSVAGFETKDIYRTVQNLIMFLKRNATQEGHTYWLVKEPGIDVVKLYDFTTLCDNDMSTDQNSPDRSTDEESSTNPFIFPVATLCYRLAERRFKECRTRKEGGLSRSLCADNLVVTERENLLDALRLVRNCLNLISLVERSDSTTYQYGFTAFGSNSTGFGDLKMRAVLLLCQIYLITPCSLINSCIRQLQSVVQRGNAVSSMSLEDLSRDLESSKQTRSSNSIDMKNSENSTVVEAQMEECTSYPDQNRLNRRLLGNLLMETFKSSNASSLSQFATGVIESFNTAIPVDPSTRHYRENDLQRQLVSDGGGVSKVSSQDGSPTLLLTVALLKLYLRKAQEYWSRSHQQISVKFSTASLPVNSLKTVIYHTLPAILLLEHFVPDIYSSSPCNPDLSQDEITCPNCSAVGLDANCSLPFDISRVILIDMLHIASCLFPAAIICFVDALRHVEKHDADVLKIEPFCLDASDCLLFRAVCPESGILLRLLFDAMSSVPVAVQTVDTSRSSTPYSPNRWIDVLLLASRCFRRIFSAKPGQLLGGEDEQSGVTKQLKPCTIDDKLVSSEVQSLMDIRPHAMKIQTSFHWWPVLVNMYVIALRQNWLDDANSEVFTTALDHGLHMVTNPPVSLEDLDGKSKFLTNTNAFQLHKLAAASAQQGKIGSWSLHFKTLPADYSPVLPSRTLVWGEDEQTQCHETLAAVTHKFGLTAVCLARAIEYLLHHFSTPDSRNYASEAVHKQLCASLLITCNEYIPSCLHELESCRDESFLSTLKTVIRHVMHVLPEDLTGDQARSRTSDYKTAPPSAWSRNTILQMLDLRLNLMNITLQMHRNSKHCGGSSQPPAWSTIVAQARTALSWHSKHLCQLDTSDQSLDSTLMINDSIMFLRLVNRLVNLQAVNLDVLSLSGLTGVLKDISITHPVLKFLAESLAGHPSFLDQDSPLMTVLQTLFRNILRLCHQISKKQYSGTAHNKTEYKSTAKRKGSRKLQTTSDTAVASDLITGIMESFDVIQLLQIESPQKFLAALKLDGTNSAVSLCQILSDKTARLFSYFS
ncbi:Erythroid differentiation factor 1 [Paragonimus skrjabini miyazakii]|uniref:Erythroid differentiation factor 1 n=1 Tax=Paragonimus skrjabini miyazakii TaxID=59628 RepID=A0A8S9Y8W2_9TREM|nr:Erythroid differentiation factor 1 [Paragonimus skrjabini miyazakii]